MRHTFTFLALSAFALGSSACKDDPIPPTHGSIDILITSGSAPVDPFVGTDRISVVVDYGECLQDFYFGEGITWQHDGVKGAPEFDVWAADTLCDDDNEFISCSVSSIIQELDDKEFAKSAQLRIDYAVNSDKLDLKKIRVGPIPLAVTAGCTAKVDFGFGGVTGWQGAIPIWEVDSYNPASSDPSIRPPINVDIIAVNP